MESRWFDYHDLHPALATYLYAEIYRRAVVEFNESFVDIRTAEDARAFTPDDIFLSRDLTAMWLARRAADAHGIPYDFVMQFTKHRALNRLFKRFPRPNQLYGEEFEIDLLAAWQDTLARSMRYSRSPKFKAVSQVGKSKLRIQHKHEIFVVEQIKKREGKSAHVNLLARMFNEGILDKSTVLSHFEEEVISKAEQEATKLGVSQR
jgi:hypothetical protein